MDLFGRPTERAEHCLLFRIEPISRIVYYYYCYNRTRTKKKKKLIAYCTIRVRDYTVYYSRYDITPCPAPVTVTDAAARGICRAGSSKNARRREFRPRMLPLCVIVFRTVFHTSTCRNKNSKFSNKFLRPTPELVFVDDSSYDLPGLTARRNA